jgi:hypothetical protein
MKKLLILLMLLLSTKAFCQEFEWPEDKKYWIIPDTTIIMPDISDFKSDSTLSMYESITYMLTDSIVSYVTYYAGDTLKVLLAVSGDPSKLDEETYDRYAMAVVVEKGYATDNGWGYTLLNNKKKKYENVIIWDWRFYEWQ